MEFYIYYHCDAWKMHDSMTVIGVFDRKTLNKILIEDVKYKAITIDDRSEDEIKNMDMWMLNSLIEYGHIEEIKLNTRL